MRSGVKSVANVQGPHKTTVNVTKMINYQAILRNYIDAKDQPGHRCPHIDVRVEWRALTPAQRKSWIKANWCLAKRPSILAGTETNLIGRWTSAHDDFTLTHIAEFYQIHHVAAFFPWHRLFVKAREHALRRCGYHGPTPYWDWSRDADTGNLATSPVLSDDFGVGGNGTAPSGAITSGPFAYFPVSYLASSKNPSIPTYKPHYVTRKFGADAAANATYPMFEEAFNYSALERVFRWSGANYSALEIYFEGLRNRYDNIGAGPHGAVHVAIGGDMNAPQSPNDSIFYLHHANVDRLWWLWQQGPVANASASEIEQRIYAYTGNTVEYTIDPSGGPAASLFDIQTVRGLYMANIETYKLMDTSRPPLCYKYR